MSNRSLKGPEEERTLDLLDELIGTIHRSRLSTFAARARKHEKRTQRRALLATQQHASRHRNKQQLEFIDEQVADEEDERVLESLSAHFTVPPTRAPAPSARSLPGGPKPSAASAAGGGGGSERAGGHGAEAREREARDREAKASLFSGGPASFSRLEDMQGDIKVRVCVGDVM